MGEMQVPNDKLYGCQTARSIVNFPIGGQADKMPKQVIQGKWKRIWPDCHEIQI